MILSTSETVGIMNRISKIIQWLLALILLGTSLWVFIKNQTLRKQIKELNHVQMKLSYLEKLLSDSRYIENFLGKLFPRIEITDVVAGKSRFTSFNNYTLVLVFSASDCQPCLTDVLKMLNEYYIEKNTSVKNKLINIGYAEDKLPLLKYRKITNTEFPFYLDVDGAVFQQLRITAGPLAFLVDSQNRITNACYITPTNLPQFESFLKTFDRFLDSH